jgi:hypothetical protein
MTDPDAPLLHTRILNSSARLGAVEHRMFELENRFHILCERIDALTRQQARLLAHLERMLSPLSPQIDDEPPA